MVQKQAYVSVGQSEPTLELLELGERNCSDFPASMVWATGSRRVEPIRTTEPGEKGDSF